MILLPYFKEACNLHVYLAIHILVKHEIQYKCRNENVGIKQRTVV